MLAKQPVARTVVLTDVDTVDQVVRTHDGEHASVDGALKGGEIQLHLCPLIKDLRGFMAIACTIQSFLCCTMVVVSIGIDGSLLWKFLRKF